MDFKLGRINLNVVAQGVGGLVFGNENPASNEDSYVESLLDRISNGVLAEDRRAAMTELQAIVAESPAAQLAFGAMGFPVLLNVIKEEHDDVEMVRGALESLVGALTPIDRVRGSKNEIKPALMNSDLLSAEAGSISLLLSLLSEDDFYVRYYTLQLLTALLTNFPNRLQEAILATPRGITRLMDMLTDREVIRNEALLLLTYLTREAEEIQKIVVFEGVFEKIFSIIREEGYSEGGVVVQDCLELLNNLLRNNTSNQMLLKETMGFEPLISILKLRQGSSYNFTQQKTVNVLSALDTIGLLLTGGPEVEPAKNNGRLSSQTVLAQKKILDYLLLLGVESKWFPISVRCSALRCIGNLVLRHPQNLDALASNVLGEEPHTVPALNSILCLVLRPSCSQEFLAAEYVFKCFCENNKDGQAMLASTMTPQLLSPSPNKLEEDANLPFGSLLLRGLVGSYPNGDVETCCRVASILSHILRDNRKCKEQALQVELEGPVPSFEPPEPLLHRIVKHLALAALVKRKDDDDDDADERTFDWASYVEPIILRLLVVWLGDCPSAVNSFLDSPSHLTYLLELLSSPTANVYSRGLAATLLGVCVLYNKRSSESGRDAFSVVDAISQKIGLTAYFLRFDEMQKSIAFTSVTSSQSHKPMGRANAASMKETENNIESDYSDKKEENPILASVFDSQFVDFVRRLEVDIREGIVEVFSHPKSKIALVPSEMQQNDRESNQDYIKRLKSFVEKQCYEIQDLLGRNATLAEDLAKTGGGNGSSDQKPNSARERVQSETLRRDLQDAMQWIEALKSEKAKVEAEASMYRNLASKVESDLKSLSDAYNTLEDAHYQLDSEVKLLKKGSGGLHQDLEAARAEAREEAQKESEAELNDLLVCLGQEQSKVERLSARLAELGEDVDSLLEGIGDEPGLHEEDEN